MDNAHMLAHPAIVGKTTYRACRTPALTRFKKGGAVPLCINQTVNFDAVTEVFSVLFEPK